MRTAGLPLPPESYLQNQGRAFARKLTPVGGLTWSGIYRRDSVWPIPASQLRIWDCLEETLYVRVTSEFSRPHTWFLLLWLVSKMRWIVSPLVIAFNGGLPPPATAVAGLSQKKCGRGSSFFSLQTSECAWCQKWELDICTHELIWRYTLYFWFPARYVIGIKAN